MRSSRLVTSLVLLTVVAQAAFAAGPRLLAPGVVSTGDSESHATLSPDGATLYFLKLTPDFAHWTVVSAARQGKAWAELEVAGSPAGSTTATSPSPPTAARSTSSRTGPTRATLRAAIPICPISGSRLAVAFLVELGTAMIVASTIVPDRSSIRRSSSKPLTSAKIASLLFPRSA